MDPAENVTAGIGAAAPRSGLKDGQPLVKKILILITIVISIFGTSFTANSTYLPAGNGERLLNIFFWLKSQPLLLSAPVRNGDQFLACGSANKNEYL
jgi:hypothetical protein